jgi:hypothetical protein
MMEVTVMVLCGSLVVVALASLAIALMAIRSSSAEVQQRTTAYLLERAYQTGKDANVPAYPPLLGPHQQMEPAAPLDSGPSRESPPERIATFPGESRVD